MGKLFEDAYDQRNDWMSEVLTHTYDGLTIIKKILIIITIVEEKSRNIYTNFTLKWLSLLGKTLHV